MKRVVIIGGGYAGVHAGKILHKAFKKDKDVSVTLIDKNSYHTLMTELHEVAGNRVSEDSVKISYNRIFANRTVNFVQDKIIGLDPKKQELRSETATYPFDYLIVAVGAEATDFNIPGVRKYGLPLWSFDDALRIRYHIQEKFRQAAKEHNEETRRKLLTFTVAGSGFTGIEMVGELIEWLPLLCEEHGISKDEYTLLNVEGMGKILTMFPDGPRAKAQRYMEKKGVKFMLHSLITEVKEGSFTLKNGTVIECGTLIWSCGVCGSKQGGDWGLTVGHVERLRVDEAMRTPEYKNIFVAGDLHWAVENDLPVPQIVEAAEQTAAVAAHNIIHDITGKGEEEHFKSNFHGFMVSIGGRYAVSHTAGISMSGIPAMAIKHLVNCYYLHSVAGVNAWFKYLKHEIFQIKNKRSMLGGLIAGKIQGLWAVPLRMWLGLMWLFEGINKIGEGWLNRPKGSSSSWMFSSGVLQRGMPGYGNAAAAASDTVSAASDAAETAVETAVHAAADAVTAASDAAETAVETVVHAAADAVSASSGIDAAAAVDTVTAASGVAADAVGNAAAAVANTVTDAVTAASGAVSGAVDAAAGGAHQWGPIWDLDKTVIPWASGFVTWFREVFMDGIAAHIDYVVFQSMVVTVECLIGLALLGGLFTFPAAGVSIIMCFVFIFSGLFSWSQVWFIFAAFLLLGGAGRTLGLDYWAQPWLKRWWNKTALAKNTYLYFDEPRFKKGKSKFKNKG